MPVYVSCLTDKDFLNLRHFKKLKTGNICGLSSLRSKKTTKPVIKGNPFWQKAIAWWETDDVIEIESTELLKWAQTIKISALHSLKTYPAGLSRSIKAKLSNTTNQTSSVSITTGPFACYRIGSDFTAGSDLVNKRESSPDLLVNNYDRPGLPSVIRFVRKCLLSKTRDSSTRRQEPGFV